MLCFGKKIVRWLLNLVFPIRCLGCGQYDIWLCAECLARIQPARAECPQCRQPTADSRTCPGCRAHASLDRLIVWADFQDKLVQRSVHALKYGFVGGLAVSLGRRLARRIFAVTNPLPANIVIVPVPLHWQRRNERGFNQAELLAHICAGALRLPYRPDALKRRKYTRPQATLSRRDRLNNLTGLFAVCPGLDFSGQIVIIIDDVATTAATLCECAQVLKQAGAAEVWGAVLARSHD